MLIQTFNIFHSTFNISRFSTVSRSTAQAYPSPPKPTLPPDHPPAILNRRGRSDTPRPSPSPRRRTPSAPATSSTTLPPRARARTRGWREGDRRAAVADTSICPPPPPPPPRSMLVVLD